jgi:hypothetical protein
MLRGRAPIATQQKGRRLQMRRSVCLAKGPVARVEYFGHEGGYVVHFGPVSVRLDGSALGSLVATLIAAYESDPGSPSGGTGMTTIARGDC